jgi:hypothetical protein
LLARGDDAAIALRAPGRPALSHGALRAQVALFDSAFYGPAAYTLIEGYSVSYAPGTGTTTGTMTTYTSGLTGEDLVTVKGVVTNGSTAGDFVIQWAQVASNANATKVLAKSFIRAGKM